MRIWHKILVAPALGVVFLLLLGSIAYVVVERQTDALDELANHRLGGVQVATDAMQQVGEAHAEAYRLVAGIGTLGEEGAKKAVAQQSDRVDLLRGVLTGYRAQPHVSDAERERVEAVLPKLAQYRTLVENALQVAVLDTFGGAASMSTADGHFKTMQKDFAALVQLERDLAKQSYEAAAAEARRAQVVLMALLVLVIVASAAISLGMSRGIVRPLRTAIGTAERIAGGDLSADVQVRGRDETAQLLRALDEMTRNLRQLVGDVSGGAHMVADTSSQIAQGNLDLSQRTEEQASTLEETASSLEELTSTVTQNADNATKASQLAVSASDVARKGGQVVGQVVSTMNGISESSKKISDIISVIDGIAFQTNILALNAAVEAARAGEQGRGFAVVAAEVRNLAQRSAAAAREIKGLITESVGQVDSGDRKSVV